MVAGGRPKKNLLKESCAVGQDFRGAAGTLVGESHAGSVSVGGNMMQRKRLG